MNANHWGSLGLLLAIATGTVSADDALAPAEGAAERPAQAAIRELAGRTTIRVADESDAALRAAERRSDPVLTYYDETRNIGDSALWVWFDGDRPVLFEKIEVNNWSATSPLWTFCLGSFAESPLSVSMEGEVRIPPSQTVANTFAPLPQAPEAGANPVAWSLQARELARQFLVAVMVGKKRNELRLLAKPLVEFRPQQDETLYGAVFGFAQGTNPDVLIQVRLQQAPDGARRWSYAIAQMTSTRVVVNYADEVVVDQPGQKAGEISNWGYFFARRNPAVRSPDVP